MNRRQQNSTAYPIGFLMVDSADHETPKTGLTPTVQLSKNLGAFAAAAGTVTELANGVYVLASNATDRNTLGECLLLASAADADSAVLKLAIVSYNPFVVELGSPVTVGPVVGSQIVSNRVAEPIPLKIFKSEARTFLLTVEDANSSPVDLSLRTLRFVVETTGVSPAGRFDVENVLIARSGTCNEIASIPISAVQSALLTPGTVYDWRLWDVSAETVLLYGTLVVMGAVKNVA